MFSNTIIKLLTKYSHFEPTTAALKAINQAIKNPLLSFSKSFCLWLDKMVQNLSIIHMGAQNTWSQNFPILLLSCQNTRFPLLRWFSRLLGCYPIISIHLCQHYASASFAKLERCKKYAFTRLNTNENSIKEIVLLEQSSLKLHQSYFLISARYLYCKVYARNTSTI